MNIRIFRMILAILATHIIAHHSFSFAAYAGNIEAVRRIHDPNGSGLSVIGRTGKWLDSDAIQTDSGSPVITSLEPSRVIVNKGAVTLIVTGNGFSSQSVVKLNGEARPARYINPSELRLQIPSSFLKHAAEIWVVVHNPDGRISNAALFTVENPIPVVTNISPTSKFVGDDPFMLYVDGKNFAGESIVQFDGVNQATTFEDSKNLSVEISSSQLASPTEISVRVFTPAPGGGISNALPLLLLERSISGTVYEDRNGNGMRDEAERGLPAWEVQIMRNGAQTASTVTDDIGNYVFSNLIPSTYDMSVKSARAWTQSQPETPGIYTINTATSPRVGGKNFGLFKNGRIDGCVFNDRNLNGIREDNEQGLSRVGVVAKGDDITLSTETDEAGMFSLTDLRPDVYVIHLDIGPAWIQTHPTQNGYSVVILSGSDTSGICFGVTRAATDTTRYRTFIPESLITATAVKPRPYASKFWFVFTNLTQHRADGLHVEFAYPVTSFIMMDSLTTVRASSQLNRDFDFTRATIEESQVVRIVGFGPRYGMSVKRWWWTYGGTLISSRNRSLLPVRQDLLLPMPNAANFRNEVFLRMAYHSTAPNPSGAGIIVGVPQTLDRKLYGWVKLRKSSDVQRSLDSPFGQHVGEPRGFDTFRNGRRFVGEQRLLPASKQNNRLFVDLVSLKLNISASELQLTPVGFGELVFKEDGNALSGMMVREIANHADTALTYWLGRSNGEYQNLDSTIRKINAAFSGPIDTISFGSQLRFAGAEGLSEAPFLRKNPNIVPRAVATESVVIEEVPLEFRLEQNFPNPFNPTTSIEFELGQPLIVTLKVFNAIGQEVMTLLDHESMEEGSYSVEFDGAGLSSGVYFYRIAAATADGSEDNGERLFTDIRKMLLLR